MTGKEFIEKYGEMDCTFSSYYKYSFTFTIGESGVMFWAGGNASDTYRSSISSTMPVWEALYELGTEYACAVSDDAPNDYIALDAGDVDAAINEFRKHAGT